MLELEKHDLRFVAERLPRDVRNILSSHAPHMYVGGGFVRACIAGETPNDVDLFGDSVERLNLAADTLLASRPDTRIHRTNNAITVLTPNRMTIQFISRWLFDDVKKLISSFDFTVCQAAVFRDGQQSNAMWCSAISDRFYQDLAARRLHYTSPVRDEEAGGSLLRVLKYLKRGYNIQVSSLGAVVARLVLNEAVTEGALKDAQSTGSVRERNIGLLITALLREVDPQLTVDGLEVLNEHVTQGSDST